jgi:hypothetical protein
LIALGSITLADCEYQGKYDTACTRIGSKAPQGFRQQAFLGHPVGLAIVIDLVMVALFIG